MKKPIYLKPIEQKILNGLCKGKSYKMIGVETKLSKRTIELYTARMRWTFDCSTQCQLVFFACKNGLVKM